MIPCSPPLGGGVALVGEYGGRASRRAGEACGHRGWSRPESRTCTPQGCFVLIYAQPLSRVAMMTVDQITRTDTGTSVCFGTQAINVPDPLAGLVSQLAASGRSHHIGIGSTPTPWLFPGHLPGPAPHRAAARATTQPIRHRRPGGPPSRPNPTRRPSPRRNARRHHPHRSRLGPQRRRRLGQLCRHHRQQPPRLTQRNPHQMQHPTPHGQAFTTVGISDSTSLDAGVALRDVQEAASHADPRTTMRYDRGRGSLDRHATYIVAAFLAGASR